MTELRYLDLKETAVSDQRVEKLQQALPSCKIDH